MNYLTEKIEFPNVSLADKNGLLAVGGDLSVKRLLCAYKHGIFPWYETGEPILWWSPDPRFVLFPEHLKISKSMKQLLKKYDYTITVNKDFAQVIKQCAIIKRSGQSSTWITNDMIEAYIKLHNLGYAKSVEVWRENKLVAGFYGVDLGNNIFSGESMFTKVNNASKIAFITFIQNTNYKLVDCQIYTQLFESLGAEEIIRKDFLSLLN